MYEYKHLSEIPDELEPIKDVITFLLDPMLYPRVDVEHIERDVEHIELHFDMLWRPHTTVYMKYRGAIVLQPDEISKSPYKILSIGAMSDNLYIITVAGLPEVVSGTQEGYFYFKLADKKR